MTSPLVKAIPDGEALLALEPQELGSRLLFLIRAHPQAMGVEFAGFHAGNFLGSLFTGRLDDVPYGRALQADVSLALREAFAWLQAQGLLIPAEGTNGQNGWMVLSRQAQKVETPAHLAGLAFGQMLPRQMLHPRIAQVWIDFVRGDYDTAAFKAMKAVEVSLRDACEDGARGLYGADVARFAFHKEAGPLTDPEAERGEKDAIGHLFAGALGTLKNPHSHRDVNLEDPADAAATVLFAGQLLRLIDARAARPCVVDADSVP